MSDFLKSLASDNTPECREVTIGGKTGEVWFRRITAAEREELLKGVKVAHTPGKGGTVDVDLGKNEAQRQKLVFYSVCNPDGTRYFKKIDEVRAMTSRSVVALATVAEEFNREDDDPGKL